MQTAAISDQKWENDHLLVVAATHGHVNEVRALLDVANPAVDNYLPLLRAVSHGHTECVKLLIPVSNITDNLEAALAAGARGVRDTTDCLKLLLQHKTSTTDVHDALVICGDNNNCAGLELLLPHSTTKNNNSALYAAVYNHSVQAFELLLPVSNPQEDNNGRILQVAANLPLPFFKQLIDCIPHPDYNTINNLLLYCVNSGDKDKVQALLPHVNVMYRDGRALRTALQYDDHAMAELLYEDSDLTLVLDLLRKDPKTKEFQIQRLIELEQAQRQKALLKQVVSGVATPHKTRKM